ncbi:MAG: hypothetical protein IJN42_06490 [Clostridia bacterium]|nr:hypothetical protein [Clostridia bacterium]
MKKLCKKPLWVYLGILFLFFVLLSYLFPYSGDDWSWGTQHGMNLLNKGFEDYNVRYLGNILEIVATRVRPLRALMEGALLTALIGLMAALNDRKRMTIAVGSTALVLLCSAEIWQQAIVWAAGFFNYVPPLVAAMFFALCMKKTLDGEWKGGLALCLTMGPVAVLAALCMENMTVFNLVLGVSAVAFVWFSRKKLSGVGISWLLGSVVGAVIMFSNGGYYKVATGEDGYRSLAGGLLQGIVDSSGTVFQYGMYQNTLLNLVLTVLLIWFVSRKLPAMSKGRALVCRALCLYNLLWAVYATVYACNVTDWIHTGYFAHRVSYTWQVLGTYTETFNVLSGLAYLISCFALLLLTASDGRMRVRVWALYGSLGVMIAPLFVVNPIGPRNFFAGYVVQILIACMLFAEVAEHWRIPRPAMGGLLATVCVLCLFWTSIYGYIFKVDAQRMEYVAEQVAAGEDTVEVIIWPYEKYVWWPRTSEGVHKYMAKKRNFRRFLGAPDDVKIEYITLAEYYAAHPDKIS